MEGNNPLTPFNNITITAQDIAKTLRLNSNKIIKEIHSFRLNLALQYIL